MPSASRANRTTTDPTIVATFHRTSIPRNAGDWTSSMTSIHNKLVGFERTIALNCFTTGGEADGVRLAAKLGKTRNYVDTVKSKVKKKITAQHVTQDGSKGRFSIVARPGKPQESFQPQFRQQAPTGEILQ